MGHFRITSVAGEIQSNFRNNEPFSVRNFPDFWLHKKLNQWCDRRCVFIDSHRDWTVSVCICAGHFNTKVWHQWNSWRALLFNKAGRERDSFWTSGGGGEGGMWMHGSPKCSAADRVCDYCVLGCAQVAHFRLGKLARGVVSICIVRRVFYGRMGYTPGLKKGKSITTNFRGSRWAARHSKKIHTKYRYRWQLCSPLPFEINAQ